MKRYIKSSSERPYLYIFKHGIGPGTLPKDVRVVRTKDLPRGYTAVWTDRFLTTSEMDEFDIPYETEINYYLDRIGYCQKNGDVVPCDDIEACGDIKASRTIDRWNHNTEKYEPVEIPDDWNVKMYSDNMDEIINCPNCGKEFPYGEGYTSRRYHNKYGMGYMECEDCYYEQLNDEFGNKDVEACDEVMASVDMSFSKKAKQLAQSAWDKGMTIPRAKKYIFDIMTKDGYSTDYETVPDTINKIVIQVYDEQGDPNDPSTWVDACDKVMASEICYRDRDNDDRVVALDAGMSDEDVEKMLAEHPSYYRSTLDRFDACDNITASANGSQGDFTVIQEIYDDFNEPDKVPPVYTQEYDVNLDEVLAKYPKIANRALEGWSDETFKAGDMITGSLFAQYVELVVRGESDQLYSDFKDYVAQHPELPDPYREIEVRINNPQCLPSAEEIRRRHSEEMGRYLGEKLGLRRW